MFKDKKKTAILFRCISVFVIFVFGLWIAGKVFMPYYPMDTDQNRTFYKTKKDSVDVLIVGSSTLLVGLSPVELWEDYGIVSHTRASTVQAPPVTYLNIKEAYNNQKPKVVVMGITSLFNEYDYDKNEPYVRRGMDTKRLSFDKMKVIHEIIKRSESQNMLDYIFPIFRYHDRWKDMGWEDIRHLKYQYDFMHGQHTVYRAKAIDSREIVDTTVPAEEANADSWEFYKKAIDFCKSQGTEVVVVNMPDDRWNYGRYLTAKELVEEAGAAYIDFNTEDVLKDIDLDWEKDFYDAHHLNPVGAQKPTAYLGEYLVENYKDLPRNQCTEEEKKQWDEDLRIYEEQLEKFKDKLEKNDQKQEEPGAK